MIFFSILLEILKYKRTDKFHSDEENHTLLVFFC